jgi:cob(I)alamin adenosyltransferase
VGNRLSKIYTRTGDDGTTGLGDGSRVPKDSLRVEAYGTVDELNSTIGMVLACEGIDDAVRETLTQVQHELFDLGGELCIPGMAMIEDADITRLEVSLDGFNEPLPPLKDFILPGGGMAAACGHLARTVCAGSRGGDSPAGSALSQSLVRSAVCAGTCAGSFGWSR